MAKIFLYIPIWLYSNAINLFFYQSVKELYIPIWLYSNIDLLEKMKFNLPLYIPIWLYSNKLKKVAQSLINNFTFQSGYIQM